MKEIKNSKRPTPQWCGLNRGLFILKFKYHKRGSTAYRCVGRCQKMHIFFTDDSVQLKPSRPKMGPIVAAGGVIVAADVVRQLDNDLDNLCRKADFPHGEPFKWLPGAELWMRENLVGSDREAFFIEVLATLGKYDCKAIFVAEDKNCQTAEDRSQTHEIDLAKLLIERADWFCVKHGTSGLIVIDRTGGDQKKDEAFLLDCMETFKTGTEFVTPVNIIMTVLSAPSRLSRLLQAADVITGCTLARVCGEEKYSPSIFEHILLLFVREADRTGGVGVKLHPFKKYGNFYHWLFRDSQYITSNTVIPLPIKEIAFSKNIEEYWTPNHWVECTVSPLCGFTSTHHERWAPIPFLCNKGY